MPVHDISDRVFAGLSTDTKPTVQDGWLFFETDTSAVYQRLGGSWTLILDGHSEAHAPESHTGQGATAAELETLTDASDADSLHTHDLKLDAADEIKIVKAADEIVNDSDVLQNDDDLLWSVGANEIWWWHLALRVTQASGGTSTNMDIIFAVPSAGILDGWSLGDLPTPSTVGAVLLNMDGAETLVVCGSAERMHVFEGYYTGGANAGTVQLQWAQNVAAVENTTLHRESMLIARRIS